MDSACLQPEEAIRQLKISWSVLMATALVVLGLLIVSMSPDMTQAGTSHPVVQWWALWVFTWMSALWLATMVPLAFIVRSHCFTLPMSGRAVDPASYVRGMSTLWGALKVTLVLSAIGCILGQALLPAIIPGVLAVILLGLTVPTASAMTTTP